MCSNIFKKFHEDVKKFQEDFDPYSSCNFVIPSRLFVILYF